MGRAVVSSLKWLCLETIANYMINDDEEYNKFGNDRENIKTLQQWILPFVNCEIVTVVVRQLPNGEWLSRNRLYSRWGNRSYDTFQLLKEQAETISLGKVNYTCLN